MAEVRSYEPHKRPRRGAAAGVEVRVRAERRRNWTSEEKLRIVQETLAPGVMAKAVAERHGISTGLLFTWRKQMLATAMAGFVPVEINPEVERPLLSGAVPEGSVPRSLEGLIEIDLPGGVHVRVGRGADLALLRGVLATLEAR
jgi:transposase